MVWEYIAVAVLAVLIVQIATQIRRIDAKVETLSKRLLELESSTSK